MPAPEMRTRNLVAAVLAATLSVGSLLAAAVPAQAADTVTTVDDATTQGKPSFSYSTGWTGGVGLPEDTFHAGTEHWTDGGDVTVTLSFRGTRAEIVGAEDPGHGYLFASVDGGAETRIDSYSETRRLQQTLFDTGTLADGDHTVVLRMDGTRNPAANKQGAQIDFAKITAPSAPEPETPGPASTAPSIIPALAQWSGKPGTLALPDNVRVVMTSETAETDLQGRTVRQEAEQLVADLSESGRSATLAVGATPGTGDIVLVTDPSVADEAYRLKIDDRVTIGASSAAGLFYGGRTLLQALSSTDALPAGETLDAPGQAMRGGMIDAGRKFWSVDYLKDLIRRMSYQKLNMLNLHLVESEGFRLDSPAFPGLADPASSYDEAEIRDLVDFAADYHVEIMPGFEFPGHATVISDYFQIGFGMGDNPCTAANMHSHLTPDWVLDMTSDKARADSARILKEFLPWFDSEYVHLGGDELPGQLASCGRVVKYIADQPDIGSSGDMLVDYLNELSAVTEGLGKRPIIYNGFEHMTRSQQTLDKDVIIQDWEGEGTNAAFDGHDKIWMNSRYAYLTPNNYHNLSPDLDYLASSWAPRKSDDMLGSSFGVWADYSMWAEDEFFEQKMGPLRAAIADRTWNTAGRNTVADLTSRLAVIGDAPGTQGFAPRERVGADAPLHSYPFEERPYPSGYTWAGSKGQTLFVEDTTGRLNGSTYIIYNPSFVDQGIKGSALSFSQDRQGVGLGGVDLPGPWTMSVWVKQTAAHPNATLLSSRSGTSIVLRDAASGNVALVTPEGRRTFDATIATGTWVAMSLVNDGVRTSLYLDGKPADSIDASMALPLAAIGAWNLSLRGLIDELNVFDAALSPAQIAANYERDASALPRPGLVNYWPLDETEGKAADVVGGADATLQGASRIDAVHDGGVSLPGGAAGLEVGASDIAGNWTAGMWVKRTSASTSSVLFAGSSTAIKLEQYKDTGKIGLTRFGVADHVIDYSAPIGDWVHLTFTSDGSTFRAYADGALVGSVNASANLGRSWIGRLVSGSAVDAAKADIDEVFVYDRTLSADEVRELYEGFARPGGTPLGMDAALAFPGETPGELEEGVDVTAELTLHNTGLVDLSAVEVTPRGSTSTECEIPVRFGAGTDAQCAIVHRVSAEDVARGFISLVVDATATGANVLATPVTAVSNELIATTIGGVRPISATIDGATPSRLVIGQPFVIDVGGPLAGSTVEGWLNSTPLLLGEAEVDSHGTARINSKLGSDVTPGDHTLVIRAIDTVGDPVEVRYPVEVVAGATAPPSGGPGSGLAATGTDASVWSALTAFALLLVVAGGIAATSRRVRRS